MKKLYLFTIMLIFSTAGFAQNQSDGGVNSFITTPIPQQFGGQEIFRFQPGLVTQLGAGSTSFNFNQKWFSIGELNTGTQMVYGLRFQLPKRALTFGYQDTSDINPRLQWIGEEEGIGDMEFRVADGFMSTSSDLVATMRSDTGTVFGINNSSSFDDAKVGILDVNFDTALEILMEFNSEDRTFGIDVHNQSNSQENYGYNASVLGTADQNFGLKTLALGNASKRYGVDANARGPGDVNFGVLGSARDASTNFGIYGIVPTDPNGDSLNPGDFAGFFEGDVEVTGMFSSSDKKLKTNIVNIENSFENIMLLKPRKYEFIKSDKKVLPRGIQYGFVAQELEEVFPELIKEVRKPVFDKEGKINEYFEYKSVNYIQLIAILTASIQELSKEVEDLKATNNSYVVYSDRLNSAEKDRLESLAYKLEQNYPNPFDGKSIIEYSLPDGEQDASIMVFDMTGSLLKTYKLREKSGKLELSSEDFKPGMYLYSLVVRNDEIMTKKMIVK
jgi:hypothetical protein